MSPGQRIIVYIDGEPPARVGNGYRRFLVLEVGRVWVTLLYLPTLAKVTKRIEELERNPSYQEIESNRTVLKRLIKRALKQRKDLDLPYSNSGTKAALELLS